MFYVPTSCHHYHAPSNHQYTFVPFCLKPKFAQLQKPAHPHLQKLDSCMPCMPAARLRPALLGTRLDSCMPCMPAARCTSRTAWPNERLLVGRPLLDTFSTVFHHGARSALPRCPRCTLRTAAAQQRTRDHCTDRITPRGV